MVTFIDEWRRKFPSCMVVKRLKKRGTIETDCRPVFCWSCRLSIHEEKKSGAESRSICQPTTRLHNDERFNYQSKLRWTEARDNSVWAMHSINAARMSSSLLDMILCIKRKKFRSKVRRPLFIEVISGCRLCIGLCYRGFPIFAQKDSIIVTESDRYIYCTTMVCIVLVIDEWT